MIELNSPKNMNGIYSATALYLCDLLVQSFLNSLRDTVVTHDYEYLSPEEKASENILAIELIYHCRNLAICMFDSEIAG